MTDSSSDLSYNIHRRGSLLFVYRRDMLFCVSKKAVIVKNAVFHKKATCILPVICRTLE